jgi:hypothetical protein
MGLAVISAGVLAVLLGIGTQTGTQARSYHQHGEHGEHGEHGQHGQHGQHGDQGDQGNQQDD